MTQQPAAGDQASGTKRRTTEIGRAFSRDQAEAIASAWLLAHPGGETAVESIEDRSRRGRRGYRSVGGNLVRTPSHLAIGIEATS